MNMKFLVLSILLLVFTGTNVSDQNRESENVIRLNQIGFYPDAPKKAVVTKDTTATFYIISSDNGDRVFSASLGPVRKSQYDDGTVRIADFSSFREPGRYRLYIPSIGYSHPFRISTGVYDSVADASLKGYYFQRASTALPKKYAGKWHRKAGHPDDSVLVHPSAATPQRPSGTVIRAPRGWYDAGDYNKYIVNSGISTATLLSLYEDFPEFAKTIETNIPERGDSIPDLLDQVLWNLRWMLEMQDPNDGGVYHKLTSANFSKMIMPAEDHATRYVVQKSTAATLDFAAVMAQASRIFEHYNRQLPGMADSCRTAAKTAWKWARKHPHKIYSQEQLNRNFDPDINTGAYGDRKLQDEFIWAAMELYVTTRDDKYYKAVNVLPDAPMQLPSWWRVGGLGYYTLVRFKDRLTEQGKQDIPQIQDRIINFADKLVKGQQQTTYETVMGYTPRNFIWGSNSVAANQGVLLIQAYKLTGRDKYWDAALSNIDYLLGRNATGYSFVTGYGDQTPMHPHHRPSAADSVVDPVPGLLVAGPNPGQQDGCDYPTDIPDKSYVDSLCAYASNEIAINWNAPFVYLLQASEALEYDRFKH